jgi:hypothetical protein
VFTWRDEAGVRQHQLCSRLAYRLTKGEIPPDRIVAHSCDWNPCCNPAHLAAETQQKNSADMAARGLHPYMQSPAYTQTREGWWVHGANGPGEANGNAKLTAATVAEIRKLYAAGGWRHVDLAERFGVSLSHVGRLVRGEAWSNVQPEEIP